MFCFATSQRRWFATSPMIAMGTKKKTHFELVSDGGVETPIQCSMLPMIKGVPSTRHRVVRGLYQKYPRHVVRLRPLQRVALKGPSGSQRATEANQMQISKLNLSAPRVVCGRPPTCNLRAQLIWRQCLRLRWGFKPPSNCSIQTEMMFDLPTPLSLP